MATQATSDTMAAAAAADRHDSVPAAKGLTAAELAAGYAKSWGLRLFAILAGVALWHWAVAAHLDFYIRFDNVPSPMRSGRLPVPVFTVAALSVGVNGNPV